MPKISTKSNTMERTAFIAIFAIFFGGIALLYSFQSVMVSGKEFSPQTFQTRSFSYWRIPGTKIRISGTSLSTAISPSGTPLLKHLPTNGVPVQWQVCQAAQGNARREDGPSILVSFLESLDADGAKTWDAWSFRNPQLAAVLWPIVQQVAYHQLYFCLPELLRLADGHSDQDSLENSLNRVCNQACEARLKLLDANSNQKEAAAELRIWQSSL